MPPMISIAAVTKRYKSGLVALDAVDLEIAKGEIFALLGPNGAGKTTLIGVVCGSVSMTSGKVLIDGHDVVRDYRAARSIVGLVPQEIALDIFSTVHRAATFSRGLFGRPPDPAYIEQLLRELSLWDKRDTRIVELSGGMKRRVMIAKALSHQPDVLFLDEPTAGVDVNLRRDMWALVRRLRSEGVTVILTTHYIEEAEEMADRVGVINNGRIVLVEEKAALMRKLGKRRLTLALQKPLPSAAKRTGRLAARTRGRRPATLLSLLRGGRGHRGADALAPAQRDRRRFQGSRHQHNLARRHLRRSGGTRGVMVSAVNLNGVWSIYRSEMQRTQRTILQSVATPVITTALYFVVFGAAIGGRIREVSGVSYGSFIVPGLMMLSLLTQSISNASIGIYFPKFTGQIYELLSAPLSAMEAVCAYVGAAATKSIAIGLIILVTAALLVPVRVEHPFWMIAFLALTSIAFSLFGFIIGIWAKNFEQLAVIPSLVVTPLTFLGGAFYSIDMLPPFWRAVSLFNPVVYLISGFRWSFYGQGDVSVAASLGFTALFIAVCLAVLTWIFHTGWRLKP